MQVRLGADSEYRSTHHLLDRRSRCKVSGQSTAHQVAIRDNPDEPAIVYHRERSHTRLIHDHRCIADGPMWLDRHARPAYPVNRPHEHSSVFRVWNVFDHGIGAGKEQRLVAAVAPPHAVRWFTIVADLQHFAVAVRLTDAMALDNDPITRTGSHSDLPICSLSMWSIIWAATCTS